MAVCAAQVPAFVGDIACVVEALDKKTNAHQNAAAERSIVRSVPKLSPITQIDVADATPGHIALLWQPVTDAQDYKLYWDKGD